MFTRLHLRTVRPHDRGIGPRWPIAAALIALVLVLTEVGVSLGLFADTAQTQNGAFTTDTLNAPTGLTAAGGVSVNLTWTATSDTYASGHRVFRGTSSSGPYSQIAQLTPRTTTTYSDDPGSGTFYYVVRAYYQNWESTNSNEVTCTKVLLIVTC